MRILAATSLLIAAVSLALSSLKMENAAAQEPLAEPTQVAAKGSLAAKVIDGKLPLFAAAAQFQSLNRVPPDTMPGKTEEERLCRQVIQYVSRAVAADSSAAPASDSSVVERLEAELDTALARGPLQLPTAR